MNPETKLWHEVKKSLSKISWTRLENSSVLGTPDLLGYNNSGIFFTVELKVTPVTSRYKVRLSAHQLAFHVRHPKHSFILVKSLAQGTYHLFSGDKILQLDACGLRLDSSEACCLGLDACHEFLNKLQ